MEQPALQPQPLPRSLSHVLASHRVVICRVVHSLTVLEVPVAIATAIPIPIVVIIVIIGVIFAVPAALVI